MLVGAGWDAGRETFHFPQDHPVVGWNRCRTLDCGHIASSARQLCTTCEEQVTRSGVTVEEFVTVASRRGRNPAGEELCLVCRTEGHERPAHSKRLCEQCAKASRDRRQSVDGYVNGDNRFPPASPRCSLGECTVKSCSRLVVWVGVRMCHTHAKNWRQDGTDVERFRRTAPPVVGDLSLGVWVGGLPPLVVHQFLYGVQRAIGDGVRLKRGDMSAVCADLRRMDVADMRDATPTRTLSRRFVAYTVTELGAGLGDRNQELESDAWRLRLWGRGNTTLDFAVIPQTWLRQAVKRWTATSLANDLHTSHVQRQIGALRRFSEHLARVAPAATPTDLDQRAKERYLAELRLDEAAGRITSYVRNAFVRNLARFLREAATTGMCDPDGPLAGMAGSFQIRAEEIPKRRTSGDAEDEVGRSLPEAIIAQLLDPANLALLTPMWQRLVRIAIDTGRRPDEICRLRHNCVDHDLFLGDDGTQERLPVLLHDQPKVKRTGVRLPITADTAAVIAEQQAAARAEHPNTAPDHLALFPRRCRNPHGIKATSADTYGFILVFWRDSGLSLVDAALRDGTIEPILDAGGQVTCFPNAAVFAYAFRHTWAQRHIDAGVPVAVLAELMGHRNINTTQAYYRIRTQQKREALDQVTRFTLTVRGTVLTGAASRSQSQRVELGSVGVPMGSCVEASNVKAHGRACPFRHRCFGCAHFRTDLSHLPDLRAYLNQLLVAREELADANPDIAEWARRAAMPSDEEIATVRGLIDACEALLDQLPPDERQELLRHIETLREARQHLTDAVPVAFLNTVAQPAPTLFPALERRRVILVTEHLLEARRADVAARTARVHAVLDEVAKHSEVPLTVVEIARRAGVHKSFIHRHPELKAALDAARAVRTQTIVGRLQAPTSSPAPRSKPTWRTRKPPAGGSAQTSRRPAGVSESSWAPWPPPTSQVTAQRTGTPVPANAGGEPLAQRFNRRLVEEIEAVGHATAI